MGEGSSEHPKEGDRSSLGSWLSQAGSVDAGMLGLKLSLCPLGRAAAALCHPLAGGGGGGRHILNAVAGGTGEATAISPWRWSWPQPVSAFVTNAGAAPTFKGCPLTSTLPCLRVPAGVPGVSPARCGHECVDVWEGCGLAEGVASSGSSCCCRHCGCPIVPGCRGKRAWPWWVWQGCFSLHALAPAPESRSKVCGRLTP